MGYSCQMRCRQFAAYLLIVMCFVAQVMELGARPVPLPSRMAVESQHHLRGLKFLVNETTVLTYHNGPILSGATSLSVYVIWYGNFSDSQRSTVLDFFTSTQVSNCTTPSVADWWKMTGGYKDASGAGVPPAMMVQAQFNDDLCSKGKNLAAADLETLVTDSLSTFPVDATAVYMILTAEDVQVADFCNSQCGSHYATSATAATQNNQLPYGWVGNPASQCPGKCSWPFAQPEYGPDNVPLLPPNGDVGIDGMIINLASILAGTATNPLDTGFYQGDGSAPLEAATACTGMFGPGSYAGYAGQLLSDSSSGVSFNTWGVNSRKYLLPALWDPISTNCTPPA